MQEVTPSQHMVLQELGRNLLGVMKTLHQLEKLFLMCSGVSPNVRFYSLIILISLVKNKNKLMLLCCVNLVPLNFSEQLNKQENVAAETTTSLQQTDNTHNINNATSSPPMPANESPKVPTGIASSPFFEQPNVHHTLSPMSSTSSLPTNPLKTPEITLPSKTLPSPVHPNPCLSSSTSVTVSSIPNTPAIATRTIFKQPTLPDPPEGKRT